MTSQTPLDARGSIGLQATTVPPPDPDLRRMRGLATGLLLLMLALFVAASIGQAHFPALAYVRAFAEAATVGASADWFAVTALFRHPFGIPIPHTAIVPRNKQRIGEALGRFICSHFLAPEAIDARLQGFDAAGWAARWLAEPTHAQLAAQRLCGALPMILDLVGQERSRAVLRDLMRAGIDSVSIAPLTARALSVLMRHGHDQRLFDLGLDAADAFLNQNKETIRAKLSRRTARWIPEWVDVRLSEKLITGLAESLAEMRDPAHPLRAEFHLALEKFVGRLTEDPELVAQCERLKSDVLDNTVVASCLDWLAGDDAKAWIAADLAAPEGLLQRSARQALAVLATGLEADPRIRAAVNQSIRAAVLAAVVPNRTEIGAFIADEVSRWDDRTLVARAENQLGKDLQFIRINGTVVGGLVGLVIFMLGKISGLD